MEKQLNGQLKSNVSNCDPADHVRLLWKIAFEQFRKYECRSLTVGDLVGYGYFGLVIACKKFNNKTINSKEPIKDGEPNYVKFSTYASYWIKSTMIESIIKYDRLIKLSFGKYRKDKALIKINHLTFQPSKKEEEIEEEENINLNDYLDILKDRERKIVTEYYLNDKTLKDLSKELNITSERIRQIRDKSIYKMNLKYRNRVFKRSNERVKS